MAATNIYESLRKVQLELKAPKGQKNTFGNYNYRSCEDILEAVKPLLDKQGLTLTISDDLQNIGDRYYVKATVTITNGDNEKSTQAFSREEETKKGMDASQITGSASSYARKYALNGMFNIDDTKDADTQDNTKHTSTPAKQTLQGMATDKQRETIAKNLAQIGVSEEEIPGYLINEYGAKLPLTRQVASEVIDMLFTK